VNYLTLRQIATRIEDMAKHELISDGIRRAIDESDLSRYRIAKEAKLSQSLLSRFMSRDRGLSLNAADKLGVVLGLRVSTGSGKRTSGNASAKQRKGAK